jgi:medium-chain acyl-[acyl-carrier-protein] hydrolase
MYGDRGSQADAGVASAAGRWFGRARRSAAEEAPARLFCFPPAGGGAALFRPWGTELVPDIDVRAVQLPGRESRIDEAPYRRLDQLLEPLCTAIEPYLDRPYALFGHSMGAMIAYELARRLSAGSRPGPVCLMVSGRRAPRVRTDRPLLTGLPDDDFLAEVERMGGMPQEVLDEPDLLSLILPVLRADFELVETYEPLPGGRLGCPVSAYLGTADPLAQQAEVSAWREETTGPFTFRLFPGDHFYLRGYRTDVLRAVRQDMRGPVTTPVDFGDRIDAHQQR